MFDFIAFLLLTSTAQAAGWQEEQDPVRCSLARGMPDAIQQAEIVSLSTDFPFQNVEIGILLPAKGIKFKARGRLDVDLGGSPADRAKLDYETSKATAGRTQLNVRLPLAALGSSAPSAFALQNENGRQDVSREGLSDKLAWLSNCREKQTAALGISPVEVDEALTPAIASQVAWITNGDVPRQRARPITYRGYMIWRIELDGAVTNCRFAVTSGEPTLDSRLCELLTKRGRYLKSAINAQGENMVSWGGRRMVLSF